MDWRRLRSVQLLSRVRLFVTPWITARQAFLSITNSQSSLKLMSIESVMPSNHLILCRPLLLLPPIPPSIRVFSMSQHFAWGGQGIGVSALASVPPMNPQDWSRLGWTGLDLLAVREGYCYHLSKFHIYVFILNFLNSIYILYIPYI